MEISKFSGHIPDAILNNNKPLEKLLMVLDGMLKIRENELFDYNRRFLYPLVSDIKLRRRYVDEWNAEYLETTSEACLECLYINYYNIYGKKGTKDGIKQLLKCLLWITVEPEITVTEFIAGKPLILSDDDRPNIDFLPNGEDIANEILGNPIVWCPTLLGDTWEHTYAQISITVNAGYVPTQDYIDFLKSVIVKYIPMVRKLVNINLTFI